MIKATSTSSMSYSDLVKGCCTSQHISPQKVDEWEILESYAQLSLEYWWVGQVGRTTLIQLTPLYTNVQIVSVGGADWNN